MRTKIRYLSLILLMSLLTACGDQKGMLQFIVPKDDDALARHFIESVRTGEYVTAEGMIGTSFQGEKTNALLRALHTYLAKGEPIAVELVGCNITHSPTATASDISYQVHFPSAFVVGDIYIQDGAILGFHFNSIPDSLENLNRFSLQGKSMLHYFVLACCVVVPCFILYALVVCIRTTVRRKWLWIIFILLALMEFQLNWTNGRWDFQPLSIVLFGSGCTAAGPYAPWILDFGMPVGAFIFLVYRRNLRVPPLLSPDIPPPIS